MKSLLAAPHYKEGQTLRNKQTQSFTGPYCSCCKCNIQHTVYGIWHCSCLRSFINTYTHCFFFFYPLDLSIDHFNMIICFLRSQVKKGCLKCLVLQLVWQFYYRQMFQTYEEDAFTDGNNAVYLSQAEKALNYEDIILTVFGFLIWADALHSVFLRNG